jgi:uncharacterized membrane protein YfcA
MKVGFDMAGFLVGLIAGSLGGIVGIGGGVIIVPLMTEMFKFGQHEAHGTSLIAVIFTGAVGSVIYYAHGSVDLTAAVLLAGMALVTVRRGAKYCCFLPELTLKRYFGFFLLFVAALFILKPFIPNIAEGSSPAWIRWIVLILLGALTGFISGMMGVGGGSFMIPMMVLFAGIAQHTAQGISLLAMIPASVVGAWTHWREGNIRMSRLPGLVVGVLVGVYVGGSFAHLIPERELRLLYTIPLLYTSLLYLRTQSLPATVCTKNDDRE